MKLSILAICSFISLSAIAGREQCIVDRKDASKTAVTTISLPESAPGSKLSLGGYNLSCDSAALTWCNFKVKSSSDKMTYTFEKSVVKMLEAKKEGKSRKGIFTSTSFTAGKAVSVTCKVPVMVRH